jgi:tetratricopeptide (TPR) repeat protein
MRRLLGMHCEYHCRWEEAVEQYETILQQDPSNLTAHKRLIAVARARGRQDEAISRLVRYTKTFASEESGWLELCERYVEQHQDDLAAFCAEELLLITPENHLYHTRYAEVSSRRVQV